MFKHKIKSKNALQVIPRWKKRAQTFIDNDDDTAIGSMKSIVNSIANIIVALILLIMLTEFQVEFGMIRIEISIKIFQKSRSIWLVSQS